MAAESLTQVWDWLLRLSKEQLVIMWAGLALLIAVSKIARLAFLLGVVGISLAIVVPELVRQFHTSPVPEVVQGIVGHRAGLVQDPHDHNMAPLPKTGP